MYFIINKFSGIATGNPEGYEVHKEATWNRFNNEEVDDSSDTYVKEVLCECGSSSIMSDGVSYECLDCGSIIDEEQFMKI